MLLINPATENQGSEMHEGCRANRKKVLSVPQAATGCVNTAEGDISVPVELVYSRY